MTAEAQATPEPRFIDSCLDLLVEARELIKVLDHEDYARELQSDVWGSAGAHLRHSLDFFDQLIDGILPCKVQYWDRTRAKETETSMEEGWRELERIITSVESLSILDPNLELDVKTDSHEVWTKSTLARELQFCANHTLHHWSLMRLTLEQMGVRTTPNFGVSNSTQDYRKSVSQAS